MLRCSLPFVAVCCIAGVAHADLITQVGQTRRGRIDFIFVGASMADSTGLTNGVNCLKKQATAHISASQLPTRPTLISATLYIGGSLLDDGLDFLNPPTSIFDGQGRVWSNPADRDFLTQAARAAADRSVQFQPPGASSPVTVTAPADAPAVAISYIPSGNEQGNVAFFVTPIDVTNVINQAGGGVLAGDYTVSGLRADVCNGLEAICGDPPGATCSTVSAVHTKGAASFALLLIVRDPALPLRSIAVFDGLQTLNGGSTTVNLQGGISISDPAAGSLAFYALEGDLSIGGPRPNHPPCNADEYIEVDGDANPASGGICLQDADNPLGNIFNSTINVEPANNSPPCNSPNLYQCCEGPGLCGVTGIDVDRFDISSALQPGANRVRVEVGTNTDQIALATLVLGVDVYQPVLNTDSQIRILSETTSDGNVRVGAPALLSLDISNTGNVPATHVAVRMDAPPFVSDFKVLSTPAGSTDDSAAAAGANRTGLVDVSGFDVQPGEVAEIRLQVTPTCAAVGRELPTVASISSAELVAFNINGPKTVAGGPGAGACAGVDPNGPFAQHALILQRQLGGGGGCAALPEGDLWSLIAILAAGGLGLRRRRRR